MSSNSPSLSTQSIAVFVGQVSGFAVNFLTPVLLVRLISKADYGVLQQFVLLGNTMLPILGLGLASSLYYFFPTSSGSQRSSYVFNTWLQMVISGSFFVLVFAFLGREILELLGMEMLGDAGNIVAVYVLFLLSGTAIDFLFILEQRVKMSMIFNPMDKLLRLILLVSAALFYGSVYYCMLALAVYAFFRFAFITYYVFANYYSSSVWKSFSVNAQSQLTYSLPFAAGIIFTTLSQRIDKLLVNRYISEAEFASYSLAFFSIPLVSQAFTSINNVVIPQITRFMANNEIKNAHNLYLQVVSKTTSLAFPAITFFTLMAPELITMLFTSAYADATPYYRIYLVMFLFTMTSYGIGLRAAKKTKLIMLSNFVGMSMTLAIGMYLIPKYALVGAIITALVGIAAPVLIQLHFERRLYQASFSSFLPWRMIAISFVVSAIATIPILALKYLQLPNIVALVIAGLIYFPLVILVERRLGIFAFENQLQKAVLALKQRLF
ncbi:oligosaccharide flippase family protein [Flavobacteriales bacterium]|nr:oligosaccharide flippase family protein [Flavobacteriales bacterium]